MTTSKPKWDALILDPGDNVATALRALDSGETVTIRRAGDEFELTVQDAIPLCHKFAVTDIEANGRISKYGLSIGRATQPVKAGRHVHIHNLVSNRAMLQNK
jgi:altronate dehydratase small subunit